MSQATLLVGAALEVVNLVLFVQAGRLVARTLGPDPGGAARSFALFWHAVGAVNGLNALLLAYTAFATPPLEVAFAVWNARIATALLGFAGLVHSLLYVYVGRAGLRVPVALFYLAVFGVMQAWLIGSQPVGAEVRDAWVGLEYAREAKNGLYLLVVVLFFVPPLLAALAYGLLLRRIGNPRQRRRARLVGLGLAAYFLALLLGYVNLSWPPWGFVESVLGIAAALLVVTAYGREKAPAARASPGAA